MQEIEGFDKSEIREVTQCTTSNASTEIRNGYHITASPPEIEKYHNNLVCIKKWFIGPTWSELKL